MGRGGEPILNTRGGKATSPEEKGRDVKAGGGWGGGLQGDGGDKRAFVDVSLRH